MFRIVVGVDFSELSMRAVDEAVRLAFSHPSAEVHLAAVVDRDHTLLLPEADRHQSLVRIADDTRDRLSELAKTALPAGLQGFAHVRVGPVADQLVSLALEIRADALVVGTHGRRGIRRLLIGSVAEKAVRMAPCMVLVVRPPDYSPMADIPLPEPPCPRCLERRGLTAGAEWWCEEHAEDPGPVHIYSRSQRLDQPLSPAPFGSRPG